MAARLQLRSPVPAGRPDSRASAGVLRRQCAGGSHGTTGGERESCRPDRAPSGRSVAREFPPIVQDVLHSAGQPLDSGTRAFMEPRFGADFSGIPVRSGPAQIAARLTAGAPGDRFEREADAAAERVSAMPQPSGQNRFDLGHVRVHSDAAAAESARQLNAHAYTLGHHVVFGAGEYAPHTGAGRNLLAHELSHVVQQTAISPAGGMPAPLVQLRPFVPRIQGKWRLDRVLADDNPEISYVKENGSVRDWVVGKDASPGAGLLGGASTWQELGLVYMKVGGRAQVAHSIRKRYIFKNDGKDGDSLQVHPIGNISGNAKAEDLHYARGGSVVWGRIRERTAANPNPPERELFSPVKDGAISAATVGDLGVIEAEIPIGDSGTVQVTIPLKKVNEGTFVTYSGSTMPSHETPSSYDEVEVHLGGRVEADSEIQTALFGIPDHDNTAHANAIFKLEWNSVAGPAQRPGAAAVAAPGIQGGPSAAGGPATAGGGDRGGAAAAAPVTGEILHRAPDNRESVTRLAKKAEEAEQDPRLHLHGVSAFSEPLNRPHSRAPRSDVEQHFPVRNTLGPTHRTIVLPKPVTNAVANTFNKVFGRK